MTLTGRRDGDDESAIAAIGTILLVILAVTLARLVVIWAMPIELDFEEAQYWAWARSLDLGYFSKPPMIAWIIAASEAACGAGEACIRSPSPILYGLSSVFMLLSARRLFGARTACWAVMFFLLAPGISFSSQLMTTDVPLLFFWSLAFYALIRLRQQSHFLWAVLLGVALGLGALSKYAMLYFVASGTIWAILTRDGRKLLWSAYGLTAIVVMAALIAPNILWNFSNGFTTLNHTAANVKGNGLQPDLLRGLEFSGEQFVITLLPVAIAFIFSIFVREQRNIERDNKIFLLCFSVPILCVLCLYSFFIRANANWAATGHVAAMLLGTATLVAANARRALAAALTLGILVQAGLFAADLGAKSISSPLLPGREPMARLLGWREMAGHIEIEARLHGAKSILTHLRQHAALFTYYMRETGLPVRLWQWQNDPANYFEMNAPIGPDTPMPAIMVSFFPTGEWISQRYGDVSAIGPVIVPTGAVSTRTLYLYLVDKPLPAGTAP